MPEAQPPAVAKKPVRLTPDDYKDMLMNAPVGILSSTPDGRFTYVNSSLARMFGYDSPHEMMNSVEDIGAQLYADPGDREEIKRLLKKNDKILNYECSFIRRDGSLFWASFDIRAVRDRGGEVIHLHGFFSDITEHVERRNSLLRTQFAMDRAPDSILWIDDEGWIVYANDSSCASMGYTREELLSMKVFDIDPDFPPEDWEWHKKEVRRRGSMAFESRPRRKDGSLFPVEVSTNHFKYNDLYLACAFDRDITERRQAENALRRRLSYERLLSDICTMAVTAGNLDDFLDQSITIMGETMAVSRAYLFEHRHETDVMDNTYEWCAEGIVPQKDNLQGLPSGILSWWVETLKSGRNINFMNIEDIPDEATKKILRPQGIFSILVVPLFVRSRYYGFIGFDDCLQHSFWPKEDVDVLLSIARVIAVVIERRDEEKKLSLERLQLLSIFDSIEESIYVSDPNTYEILFVNQALEKLLGKNVIGGICYRELQGLDSPCPFCTNDIILKQHPHAYRWEHYNHELGRAFSLHDSIIRWSDGRSVRLKLAVDITERKLTEEHLKENEELLRSLLEVTPVGVSLLEGRLFKKVNRAFCRITGHTQHELVGMPTSMLYPDEKEFNRVAGELNEQMRRDGLGMREEVMQRKDGKLINVIISLSPVNPENISAGLCATVQDITEQKQAEEALRESEKKYRFLAEAITDIIWTLNLDLKTTYVSPSIAKILGFTPEERIIQDVEQTMTPESYERAMDLLARELEIEKEGGADPGRFVTIETEYYHKDGRTVWMESVVSLMRDCNGNPAGIHGVSRDITERKHAEEEREKLKEQLNRSQKLESIGTLAGGIAHDFNNLLMGIQGHASLMMLDLDPSHPHYIRLKQIEEQIRNGADLTGQLLGFARGGRYELKPTDLNDVIETTSGMFGRTKKEISIHKKLNNNLWIVEADRTQMGQVFMNLFVNAWQAMPGGGEIFLETANHHVRNKETHPLAQGKYVKITVSDTGMGMDAQTREQIFDPFFTTKGMGRGTGLGLATVYGIIKGHGGMIDVTSEPGQGTTFEIYLPTTEKTVVREDAVNGECSGGTETILLIDDEVMVLDVARAMLQSLGYRVYCAGSGQEGVAVYHEKKDEIDLVILDMIMPGISGGEAFDRLREIDPTQKVLPSSGYSVDGKARQILEKGCNGFLQKPFRLEQLAREVRTALEPKEGSP
ncbi:MAG TPA: PAS domain S-box protein [Deltaproteobacteria bacterium]|nr:PAS domain S-box protein [Deltaproteobacteria bacterium]